MVSRDRTLKDLLATQEAAVLGNWMQRLRASGVLQTGRVSEAELDAQARTFLGQLVAALGRGATDPQGADFQDLRLFLADLSRTRALQGYSPSETATFVLSLKEPLFTALRAADMAGETAAQVAIDITLLLDQLALQTVEAYQRTREEVILRQHREIAELSTPVVKLWQGILALPLIGTLDSERTQVVMVNLLQSIVDNHALVDGNKRLGWLATAVFLEINDASVAAASNDDVYELVMAIAAGASTTDGIADKLQQLHRRPD